MLCGALLRVRSRLVLSAAVLLLYNASAWGQAKRKIIIDQDAVGPSSTDQRAIVLLVQSPQTEVLGVTVVTGDGWIKEEVAHTLRTLEILGRADIPVVAGASQPLVRRRDDTERWQKEFGAVKWMGVWTPGYAHPPDKVRLPEGAPTTKQASEDAPHFLVRMLHAFPHEITIFAGGPLTNIALALSLDPEVATLAKELVFMGASFDPHTSDAEFATRPRHEFNMWFDPEAAHIVLQAAWKKITCTPVDISIKVTMTQQLLDRLKSSRSPAATYVVRYTDMKYERYLWDELGVIAWLEPRIITKAEARPLDIDIEHGATYGDTLSGNDRVAFKPRFVDVQVDLDIDSFYGAFVRLLSTPTPPR